MQKLAKEKKMPKKSIIAVLCAVACLVIASVALVLTSELWAHADSGEVLIDTAYLNISADGKTLNGFTEDGQNYVNGLSSYKVVVPASVTSIGNHAFSYCSGLTSIKIPASVTSIGNYAFSGCSSLRIIEIPDSVTSIGNNAFSGCYALYSIKLPNGLSALSSQIFRGCNNLSSVELPSSVTTIGKDAFCECTNLHSITLPANLTSIGDYAFGGTNLRSITLPANLTSIGDYAFTSTKLYSIEIPDGVTGIGNGVFCNCTLLSSITLPANLTSIGESAFRGCNYNSFTSITLPANLTTIGDYAFEGCSWLRSIGIPDGVTSIGKGAFSGCSLYTIKLSNNLTSIGDYAFIGLPMYSSPTIILPASLVTVGKSIIGNGTSGMLLVKSWDLMDHPNLADYKNAGILHYTAEQNVVTFDTMGGSEVAEQIVNFGEFAEMPTTEKEHYHVVGWYQNREYTRRFYFDRPIEYYQTLYAKWAIDQYKVTFDYANNSVDDEWNVGYGSQVDEPVAPTREGYVFKGWYVGDEKYDFTAPVTGDMVLTAKWEPVPASVNVGMIAAIAGVVIIFGTGGVVAWFVIKRRHMLK